MADLVITEKANIVSLADKVRMLDGSTAQLSLYEMKNKLDAERNNIDNALDVLANKGVQVPEGSSSAALPELIEAVKGTVPEENEVNFYDYDGTLLYSYTLEEANNLTELPIPPSHEGLVFDGWNWDLEDVQALTYPMDIGACYQTDDGSTRFYVRIDENLNSLKLSINLNGSYEIDWGDGTEKETITLEEGSLNHIRPSTHTYVNYGDYVIKVKLLSGEAEIRQNPFYNSNQDYYYAQKAIKKVEVGQIQMAEDAFKDCFELSNVSMPNNCLLKNSCFYHTGLKFIVIPKNNIKIPNNSFGECYQLIKLSLNNNLTEIGSECFYKIPVSDIKIGNKITTIASKSFYNSYLQSIILPESVSSIESNSFFGTPITEIILPESITIIPSRLFQSCSYLAKITILGDITEIGQSAFDNCGTLKSIIIPDTTATIGDYCFRYCKVIQNIIIPNSVISIGADCFDFCSSLTNVILSNNITKIPSYCFADCTNLPSIIIPNGVQTIDSGAFYNCYNLQYIDFSNHTSVPTLSNKNAFSYTTCVFRVPSALLDEWKAATNWSTYADRIVGV